MRLISTKLTILLSYFGRPGFNFMLFNIYKQSGFTRAKQKICTKTSCQLSYTKTCPGLFRKITVNYRNFKKTMRIAAKNN